MTDDKPDSASIIALEVNGEGVSVETVDAPLLLDIASSFFALVQANAKHENKEISLNGITITNKCIQIAAHTNNANVAQFFVEKTHLQISGELPALRGVSDLIRRAKTALRRAPSDWSVIYKAGTWAKPISLAPKKIRPMREMMTSRATVNKLNGAPHPNVRLESRTEAHEFTLKIKKDHVRRLGNVMLSEIDLQAIVQRTPDGIIESGKLIDFEPVKEITSTIKEWEVWYKANAAEWDSVKDIESELKARSH